MYFWIGWLCGIGAAWLQGWLWRYLRLRKQKATPSVHSKGERPCNPTELHWAQTRNFLYYDGTEMPVVKTYKEGNDGKQQT